LKDENGTVFIVTRIGSAFVHAYRSDDDARNKRDHILHRSSLHRMTVVATQ
jgi:hypothetical protein